MSTPLQDPIIGIDLGTTNSLVAIVRDGKPEVLTSREGRRLVPSVVSFVEGKPVVGYSAKSKKIRDARHTIFSVKRLLGRGFEDVVATADTLPYKIVADQSEAGASQVKVEVEGMAFSAIEVSAMILKELRLSAEAALGTPVKRAVITVPAYFNDSQRQATRAAGRLAGLDVLRIINEPTAASLAYGLDRKKQGLIAVYDLGGGTFDVSILKLHDGIFEVLATNGDTTLGGDDLDQAIVRVASREIEKKFGFCPLAEATFRAALLEQAENVKIALSEHELAEFSLDVPGAKRYSRRFTRAEFEALARPMLERTREPCLRALADAGLKPEDLSDVVMVGGPTRLKLVQDVAREIFGREPNTSVHPDEVVAVGAAIQADILAGNNQELLLLDVVPLTLGIETYGGLMSPLIARNTRIPAVAREVFTNFADRQTAVDVHVLQGERDQAVENRSLARFKLRVEPLPAGMVRVEVTYLIDADGILQVAAKDLRTGKEQSVEVRPSYGLTDSEVEHMLEESARHHDEDLRFRKLAKVKNEAEALLRVAESKIPDAYRLLPEPEAREVEESVQGLKTALSAEDPIRIHDATFRVTRATNRLAELLLEDATKNA